MVMRRIQWDTLPKDLIDDAEILFRQVFKNEDLHFVIMQSVNLGLAEDNCMSQQTRLAYDWNDLSEMGLLAFLNWAVFHPKGYAIARDPDTGESNVILVEDEPWTFTPSTLHEEISKTDKAKIKIEGWNVPFGDC